MFLKLRNIHRKTLVLEFLLNSEYCKIFKSTYSEELRTAASENVFMKLREIKNCSQGILILH